MLPEIAAEALQFLSRRDLDKASAVGKWLDALITQCFEVYPLRPVASVGLYRSSHDSTSTVFIDEDDNSRTDHSFGSMDDALFRSRSTRPSGSLLFIGDISKQRGLSAYAQYLAPARINGTDDVYRFPSTDHEAYEVVLSESAARISVQFGLVSSSA